MLIAKTVLTSAEVSMLSQGFFVSQYPQLYDQELYNYQVLTRPYLKIGS